MFRRKNLYDRRRRKFYAILAPLVKNWSWSETVSPEVNAKAKADLCEFLRRAKLLLPKAKIYDFEPLGYHDGGAYYLRRQLAVKRHLEECRWDNACHELYDVVHFDPIQDRRVLYTIIGLLEAYLSTDLQNFVLSLRPDLEQENIRLKREVTYLRQALDFASPQNKS